MPVLLVVLLLPLLAESKSIELKYDPSVDTSLLPYSVVIKDAATSPCDRPPVRHSLRAVTVANRPDELSTYVRAMNPLPSESPEGHLNWSPFGHRAALDEMALLGTLIEDIAVVPRGDSVWIFGTALRSDSLYLFKAVSPEGKVEWISIAQVVDRDGDGKWSGNSRHLLTADYDFDGQTELFFYFNAVRDSQPRELVCIEADSFHLEWRLKVASPVYTVFTCGDTSDPGVIFATEAPGQGVSDSIFRDRFGYLGRVDRKGKVAFALSKSTYPFSFPLDIAKSRSEFYILGLTIDDTTGDTRLSAGLLERISANGQTISQVSDSQFSPSMWAIDLDDDGVKEILVFNADRSVQVFSAALEKLYHSEPGFPAGDAGFIERFDGIHDARLIPLDGERTGIFDAHFNLLALLPKTSQCEVLGRDSTGQVTALILNEYTGRHYFASLSRRSNLDLAVIFYRKNHVYFLSGSFALLAALFVTAFYQRRTKANLRIIDRQRQELAEAHQKLKDAQPAIIAREKYLQAKDIAGGFAHEIRNALFPADSAITKIKDLSSTGTISQEKLERCLVPLSVAVTRAVGITQIISSYTKLESEHLPERVLLPKVIERAIAAHKPLLENKEAKVVLDGPENTVIESNLAQLDMVFSNLILNSLDALTDRTTPIISIKWQTTGDFTRVTFSDNGAGIPEEILPRIFDTFFSTKPNKGTGLGLSLTKKIIEMYGGTISATSTVGAGTSIEVRLRPCD
ncbi:MAG: HAMP domain-containing histidine kinase [bacterium]|nr:HAMP domain-containing histidine kinase [bacterium]